MREPLSGREWMMRDDLHALSGAYAVHALPYAEWALFERHLHACPGCSAEVLRLRETAARLAESVAVPPPAGLRARLLTAARRSRSAGRRPDPAGGPAVRTPPREPASRQPQEFPVVSEIRVAAATLRTRGRCRRGRGGGR
ncbi:hypothetical protein ACFQYP_27925 [Nonomuraea antimicrobica]